MSDKKTKINWTPWVIAFAVIPFVVCILMMLENPLSKYLGEINETHWLSFFGGYIGACITGAVTLYVLRITYNQNNKNIKDTLNRNQTNHAENQIQNNRLLQLQINTTKYNRAMQELDAVRNVLDENYKILDYQRFAVAVNFLFLNEPDKAMRLLLDINRDIEMAGNKSDLYLNDFVSHSGLSNPVVEYLSIFKHNQLTFGSLVNDFIFVSQLNIYITRGKDKVSIDGMLTLIHNEYKRVKNNARIVDELLALYESPDNIYSRIIDKLNEHTDINSAITEIEKIISEILDNIATNHNEKVRILGASNNLISYLESEANKILTENIEN